MVKLWVKYIVSYIDIVVLKEKVHLVYRSRILHSSWLWWYMRSSMIFRSVFRTWHSSWHNFGGNNKLRLHPIFLDFSAVLAVLLFPLYGQAINYQWILCGSSHCYSFIAYKQTSTSIARLTFSSITGHPLDILSDYLIFCRLKISHLS